MTIQELLRSFPSIFNPSIDSIEWDIPQAWTRLVYKLCKKLTAEGNKTQKSFACIQMKEKFGALRFYFKDPDHYTKESISLIGQAAIDSTKICQFCGSRRNLVRTSPWVYYLCERCAKEKHLSYTSAKLTTHIN